MASEKPGCSAIYGSKTIANLQCCYCDLCNDRATTETSNEVFMCVSVPPPNFQAVNSISSGVQTYLQRQAVLSAEEGAVAHEQTLVGMYLYACTYIKQTKIDNVLAINLEKYSVLASIHRHEKANFLCNFSSPFFS